MHRKHLGLLVLGGILLAGTALLFERQMKTQSALQRTERELEYLEHNNRLGQDFLDQTADSLSPMDREYVFVVARLRQGHAAADELSELVPVLQEQRLREQVGMWVLGICGAFFLMLYLRRARPGKKTFTLASMISLISVFPIPLGGQSLEAKVELQVQAALKVIEDESPRPFTMLDPRVFQSGDSVAILAGERLAGRGISTYEDGNLHFWTNEYRGPFTCDGARCTLSEISLFIHADGWKKVECLDTYFAPEEEKPEVCR